MDPRSRENRSTILMSIAVFAMICPFWAVAPTGIQAYRSYRIKATLRSFHAPPETTVMSIETTHVLGVTLGTGIYFTYLSPEQVKAHYATEFARHGFSYKGETTKPESRSVHFCATPYFVDLNLSEPDQSIPIGGGKAARIYTMPIYEVAAC